MYGLKGISQFEGPMDSGTLNYLHIASKGCIVHGPTVRWKKLFIKPSRGHVVRWERHADDRYDLATVILDKTDGFRGCMDVGHTDKRCAHCRTRL